MGLNRQWYKDRDIKEREPNRHERGGKIPLEAAFASRGSSLLAYVCGLRGRWALDSSRLLDLLPRGREVAVLGIGDKERLLGDNDLDCITIFRAQSTPPRECAIG